MVTEAEQFATEDDAQRERIDGLNSLSFFVYGLKNHLGTKRVSVAMMIRRKF
jgi:endoplasmic reticulum chaperone BiP